MAKESKFDPWSERKKLYDEINRKRWSKAENLGKIEGIPEGWTLCDIGPQNAYIELSDEAIRKIDGIQQNHLAKRIKKIARR